MKAVILAGGLGTRISEETQNRPKPMIEIGGKPILWHIMKMYSAHGITEFVICLGYKGYLIKEYFTNYFLHMSDITIDLEKNDLKIHHANSEPWKVTLVDTGEFTMTGGRIKRISEYVNETFCVTYGDGLSDVNIKKTIEFHKKNNLIGTLTAVQPTGRFGSVGINGVSVEKFIEKPSGDFNWINGGFFIFEPEVMKYFDGDSSILEQGPLQKMVEEKQLGSYKHDGFWQSMDTLRDKNYLEELWNNKNPPWKKW
jgi:glucose-1-phosphate cytidylyltransferase